MKEIYESLIESYQSDNIGISNEFLNKDLALGLKTNLLALFEKKVMTSAGTGNENIVLKDTSVRSDKIYWLDKNHDDPFENTFFVLMDDFIAYLNETCFTGIRSYEFHYALYEKGCFYKRHFDRFRNDDRRLFSMIMYLNTDWKTKHGGELNIFHKDGSQQQISPSGGRSVFFKSDQLEHEVLETNVPRLSITGWLKR
ncbi:MAG: 2OG-Fe(II) oxygenase [Saprospiraceae bacterium]|nr:2OG-Fe(II) oxygenase [Saprospiraceae bacterium]